MDNGVRASFNGRLRDERVNVHEFLSVERARVVIEHQQLCG